MFFSAQPFDPAEVASVAFDAGGVDLGTDRDASDGFRVFLNVRDLSAGEVRLLPSGTLVEVLWGQPAQK